MKPAGSSYNVSVTTREEAREAYINFSLQERKEVLLRIIDAEDREVRLLLNEIMPPGKHCILFVFGNLTPSEYTLRLMINNSDAVDIETQNIKIN